MLDVSPTCFLCVSAHTLEYLNNPSRLNLPGLWSSRTSSEVRSVINPINLCWWDCSLISFLELICSEAIQRQLCYFSVNSLMVVQFVSYRWPTESMWLPQSVLLLLCVALTRWWLMMRWWKKKQHNYMWRSQWAARTNLNAQLCELTTKVFENNVVIAS